MAAKILSSQQNTALKSYVTNIGNIIFCKTCYIGKTHTTGKIGKNKYI